MCDLACSMNTDECASQLLKNIVDTRERAFHGYCDGKDGCKTDGTSILNSAASALSKYNVIHDSIFLAACGRSCLRGPKNLCAWNVSGGCRSVAPSLRRHHNRVYILIISDFIADSITKSKRCIYERNRTVRFALMPTDKSYIEIEIGVISSQNWYCSIPSKKKTATV